MYKIDFDTENIESGSFIVSAPSKRVVEDVVLDFAKRLLDDSKPASNPDFIMKDFSEASSIKIDDIRQIIHQAQLKPYQSKRKVITIMTAEKMTDDAQNALLKTLEDIPKNTIFILGTGNHKNLLQTIVSRSKLYEFVSSREGEDENMFSLEKLLSYDTVERFQVVEEIIKEKDKYELAEKLIRTLLGEFQKEIKAGSRDPRILNNIKLTEETMTAISKNVNLRLALESLMLNLK